MMRGATLFSGIGAPECSAPSIDWLWGAEIEAFPSAVLAHRFPKLVNLGDVSADDFCERAERVGRPDVLVFGSPCQSFSVAGKRLGMDDPRGNLALVALGIARRLRPQWLVFENVPGLLSSLSGSEQAERQLRDDARSGSYGRVQAEEDRDFAAFLTRLRECGYLGCYRVYNAEFAGVPQRRRRIFLVAYLGDWRPPAAVLLEPESLSGNPSPRRETGERIAPTISARPSGGGGLGADFDLDGGLIVDGIARCVTAGYAQRIDWETENFVAFDTTQITSPTNRSAPKAGGDCRGLEPQEVTMALTKDQTPAMMDRWAVRRLTPTECERLQGFPDGWTDIPYRNGRAADGPRYKALGNSMAVPVVGWILDRVQKVDAVLREARRAAA